MIQVTEEHIDVGRAVAMIDQSGAGSVVFHLGVVKSDPGGKKSKGLLFQPLPGLEAELRQIEADLRATFKIGDVLLIRRIGRLRIGDSILLAVISANGREDAFGACREAVERFRKMKSIDKTELLV